MTRGTVIVLLATLLGLGVYAEPKKEKGESSVVEKPAPGGTHKIVYKKLDGGDLSLEIDLPDGPGPFPVVVYVHGGGWNAKEEPDQFKPQSWHMTHLGIAGVRILYRGKKRGGFDENMQDVMDAIDFVRKNAQAYRFDMKRVGIAGGSAGGHLSAIAAQRTPECIAYVGFNGLYDLKNIGAGSFAKDADAAGNAHSFLGKLTEKRLDEVSAFHQIKTPPPDTLLIHGTADTTIDPQQSVRFAEAIRAKGGRAKASLYKGQKHGFFNVAKYKETLQELETHLLRVFDLAEKKSP